MAVGGAESVPGVGMHKAYRFTASDVTGFVYKVRSNEWDAVVPGTAVAVREPSRREAIELALRQARASG